MGDFWGSVKDTAKSLGGAVAAPVGAVVDLAQMPFDNKDDNFGSVVHIASEYGGKVLDPVVNPSSAIHTTGAGALDALNWAYKNIIDEPLSTAAILGQHIDARHQGLGITHGAIKDWFDGSQWAAAYKQAQDTSTGQALASGTLDAYESDFGGRQGQDARDPLAYDNFYQDVTAKEHSRIAPAGSLGLDLGVSFAADPTFFALKGVGAARGVYQYGRLNAADKAHLLETITSGSRSGSLRRNLESRTDKYLNWLGGENPVGRPLSAPEIYHGTPELKRYAKDPEAVAGFLADANKITDPLARRDAQRRILAVAGGDLSQVARLRTESDEAASIADQLANMSRQGVIDLDALAIAPHLANNPVFRLRLENQLSNLNKRGAVDKFIDDFISYNDRLLETQKSLPNLPGVHAQGNRAVNRLNDQGAPRALRDTVHRPLDDWSSTLAQKAQSTSSVFQKGKYTVPLVAVRTVGLAASPWTKAPIAVSDALRQTHFTGIASIHDWGSATTQLDSMMRLGRVEPGERMGLLGEAYTAGTESAKQAIIEKVERASMHGLTRWASARAGHEIDSDYITELMMKGAASRSDRMTSLQGRVYATTEASPEMATRMAGANAIEDSAALGQSGGLTAKSQGKWRLDQINDDGTPLALPVFETQLGNYVPLFDIDLARRSITRDTGYFSRLSKAWRAESMEMERLAGLKAKGATGLDAAIRTRAATRDWLVDAGQTALRAWKFSVLFRLGYPLRVLTDDHMRITAKLGAASFYGPNLHEFGSNVKFNQMDRKLTAKAQLHDLKTRRRQILDELDGNEMMVHQVRQDDLASVQKSIAAHQRALSGLRKQVTDAETKASLGLPNDHAALTEKLSAREGKLLDHEAHRDYLLEQLGDYGPNELKRELDDIEAQIAAGTKSLREPKRHIGSADISLDDGTTLPGAFAGEYGDVMRAASSSGSTYEHLLEGAEGRSYRSVSGGSHRTIQPEEPGHLDAWADVLNNQIGMSSAGRYFLEGGDAEGFARWLREPDQALLRRRVAHFAYDPEDWAGRIQGIVHDYVPNDEVRQALLKGKVTGAQLRKMTQVNERPSVHGRAVADNLGVSTAAQAAGRAIQRVFTKISEAPTDVLSRHPYFNSLYRMHAQDFYEVRKASGVTSWTPEDAAEISRLARKAALKDLKSTLFDLSAHSHAAHVMRFISPFFGAHQEGVMRWWRIAADKPQIARRLTQFLDVPRRLQIEVDENGDLVKPGAPLSSNHRILLQLPQAFGGVDPTKHQSSWSINEQAFNIILQGGLTNPGAGPLVSVPVDWAAEKYADDPAIARVARVFNPYPANNPLENVFPAAGKRMSAYIYGKTGHDPSFGLGIGKREYNAAFSQNVQDAMVDFNLKHGREPNRSESDALVERAGAETTSQMFHRFLWNIASPAPASPRSKYALIQQGWFKIQEQAKAEGKDFDWAYQQFKAKYKDAYLPLIFSTSNNPGWVDADPADVAAIKHYKGVLQKVDPALSRMVIGSYAEEMIAKDKTLGDYSVDARNFLRNEKIKPGSDQTYYSYDEPAQAVNEQMARRGWQKYGELTGSLTAMAQHMGLSSYNDDPRLVAAKQQGVAAIMSENYAFADEWKKGLDEGQFDRYLDDMRQIASAPVLANDSTRTDIKTLQTYLRVRDIFTKVFAARKAAGMGGPDAQAQDQIRQAYTQFVGRLVESDTTFETYMFNGTLERDPLLLKDAG